MFAFKVLGDAELIPVAVHPICPSCKAPIRTMWACPITGDGQYPDDGKTVTSLMHMCSKCGAVLGITNC